MLKVKSINNRSAARCPCWWMARMEYYIRFSFSNTWPSIGEFFFYQFQNSIHFDAERSRKFRVNLVQWFTAFSRRTCSWEMFVYHRWISVFRLTKLFRLFAVSIVFFCFCFCLNTYDIYFIGVVFLRYGIFDLILCNDSAHNKWTAVDYISNQFSDFYSQVAST